MSGFKNIYYDKFTNKLTIWEIDENGKTTAKRLKPVIDYYIKDESGQSEMKDIWGNAVKQQVSRSVSSMKNSIKMGNIKTCEANIDQEIKYLQKTYANKTIKTNISDFQVCTIDIEVAIGSDPKPFQTMVDECDCVINLITVHYSKQNKTYTWGNKEYSGNYRDIDPDWTYFYIPDEKNMLESFITHFRKKKVDIITGWNVKLFDMRYMIDRIEKLLQDKGTTMVPLEIFTANNRVKVKLGVVKGKKLYDKRAAIKKRDIDREIRQIV
jgi:DNA polymerase elongation subunit (family B)